MALSASIEFLDTATRLQHPQRCFARRAPEDLVHVMKMMRVNSRITGTRIQDRNVLPEFEHTQVERIRATCRRIHDFYVASKISFLAPPTRKSDP